MSMERGEEKIPHKVNLYFQSSSTIGAQKVGLKKKKVPENYLPRKKLSINSGFNICFFHLLALAADFMLANYLVTFN